MRRSEKFGVLGVASLMVIAAGYFLEGIWWLVPLGLVCATVCLYYQITIEKEEEAEAVKEDVIEP